jgi:hypothetical protein
VAWNRGVTQAYQADIFMLPNFPIKTISDLELVFIALAKRASVLGVPIPELRGSKEDYCKYTFRNYGTYRGNPFDVLEEHLMKEMGNLANEVTHPRGRSGSAQNMLAIRVVLNDVIYYKGTWNLLNE